MSSGMVISGSMVASFLENRPFTRSLSGKKTASSLEALHTGPALRNNHALKLEEVRNVQSDTELLTSFGEATLPSPGALDNREGVSEFLSDIGPSPKWGDMIAKGEWSLPGGLGEELPSLFDAHASFPPQRPDTDATMIDTEEGINGSVEQTQPPASADVSMGDVDNGNVDNGNPAATDTFLSSLFDWDKLGNTPTPKKEEGAQNGGPVANAARPQPKAPSPAIRYTRSRSFELRKLVEQKGYSADNVMKAIDEGKVDPAVVWAKAAAENAAASRPAQENGVKTEQAGVSKGPGDVNNGQPEKERPPDMAEELKRLVNRTNQQTTVPIRGSRQSPHQSPLSYLSPRLRELLDAQLPDSPFPSSITQSEGASGNAGAQNPSVPPLMTVPLTQPRHRGRPQPLKGLTSAQKIEPLRAASSDPGSLSRKRGPSTEMLPPVKRSSSNVSDNALGLGRTSSSISEVVRAYSEIRTSEKPPIAKPAETKRRGRGEKETKPAPRKTPQPQPQSKPPAPVRPPVVSPVVAPSHDVTQLQLVIKAQKADQLEEENRGLKQYLTFLNKKDGLQTKLIEQLEQQLMRVTEERDKLLAATKKR
ncbi:hypothetical protein KFL_003570150 [Klebsormidium nitens]|uniref:Uncharacterized protein n=1 Tax=Klebsormidium nitens TaxID=105231 RepID=A0A1Y1IFG8_KLENI|nr:hypothetical protein KFL_003570150 [Klebsormidium nitens]|eukprot:GAQ87506.1 hypothetical protein KFL_003570150 [Klebsormidium nitens]